MRPFKKKRLQTGLRAAQDQGVDVVGALVRVDGLEVLRVSHHVVVVLNAVAAVHVAGKPRDIECLAAIVALDEGDHFRRHPTLVEQAADPQRRL